MIPHCRETRRKLWSKLTWQTAPNHYIDVGSDGAPCQVSFERSKFLLLWISEVVGISVQCGEVHPEIVILPTWNLCFKKFMDYYKIGRNKPHLPWIYKNKQCGEIHPTKFLNCVLRKRNDKNVPASGSKIQRWCSILVTRKYFRTLQNDENFPGNYRL